MKRIVILTGSELRHAFVRRYLALAPSIEVVRTYCEGLQQSLASLVHQQENSDLRRRHVAARAQSEQDFFGLFLEHEPDYSRPVELAKGQINEPGYVDEIVQSDPDLVIAYGCSLIREPLLSHFQGRLLNVHLGLSPYYRGTGTNFWPLVKGEPELVGATFMHMDQGVDTGAILHQIRARVAWGDTPAALGNRLIVDMARVYRDLIERFDTLAPAVRPSPVAGGQLYRRKDFSEDSVRRLYANFQSGMIERYLSERDRRCAAAPLVENPALLRRTAA